MPIHFQQLLSEIKKKKKYLIEFNLILHKNFKILWIKFTVADEEVEWQWWRYLVFYSERCRHYNLKQHLVNVR